MKRITGLDILGMPSDVAAFQKTTDTITCLAPATDAGLIEAITATLKKLDSKLLPDGRIEVRSDGTLHVDGRYFAPEPHDESLFELRKQFDKENNISVSDRVLLPGKLKSEVVRAGGVVC
jgi:hypothetical protein